MVTSFFCPKYELVRGQHFLLGIRLEREGERVFPLGPLCFVTFVLIQPLNKDEGRRRQRRNQVATTEQRQWKLSQEVSGDWGTGWRCEIQSGGLDLGAY